MLAGQWFVHSNVTWQLDRRTNNHLILITVIWYMLLFQKLILVPRSLADDNNYSGFLKHKDSGQAVPDYYEAFVLRKL